MPKIFIILGVVFFIFLSVIVFLVFFYSPLKQEVKIGQSNNILPVDDPSKTATAFGVKILDKCLLQFNDFIKNYGQDYFKCLVDFNSTDEYCGGFDPETQGLSNANVIVILDSSGSMAEQIDGQPKIDIAKKAVSDFLTQMPKSVNTGLVVYGHKGSNSLVDKNLSCNGIEEVVKLGRNNNSNIIAAINSFGPNGWTPVAGSLAFVKNIFNQKGKTDKNYLILVSDGVESCDGDALTVAEDLKAEILGIKLSVIGFTTDNNTREFLKRVANLGGGSYLNADNSSGIAKAFNDQLLVIKKGCINVTLLELSLRYKSNNLANLNCWLNAGNKESDDFHINLEQKSADTECNLEVSQALVARQTQFWYQKQDLEVKNSAVYDKIKLDLNRQLQLLQSQGS